MLKAKLRDLKLKCRKFRNEGRATGLLKRKNGENVPISIKGSDLDKLIQREGREGVIDLQLNEEVIQTEIIDLQRHLLVHNIINIDLKEI
ncbi:hypothetical protein [Clostridium tarantellae]|uniref:Large ribosomal subunit protein bL25 L25 domain-containing protein n=1 Tax=Clostridium tarantellae TaxID=39493 RepID=A0A6I1MHD8_9CLOT|nr:hypothetical protein [Clostridium tarantellae]MPQ42254.1 hypothetical protein [Clostridium tarantellae]